MSALRQRRPHSWRGTLALRQRCGLACMHDRMHDRMRTAHIYFARLVETSAANINEEYSTQTHTLACMCEQSFTQSHPMHASSPSVVDVSGFVTTQSLPTTITCVAVLDVLRIRTIYFLAYMTFNIGIQLVYV